MPALAAVADTVLNDPDQATLNASLLTNFNAGIHCKKTAVALVDSATVTAAQVLTGKLAGTPVTARQTYTLPTAALLVAAISGASVGDTLKVVVSNLAASTSTDLQLAVAAGSGGTLEGSAWVNPGESVEFTFTLTNVTASSEAYTVVSTKQRLRAKQEDGLTDNATMTAAQMLSGYIRGVPTAGAAYACPTAANMVAAIPGAKVGDLIPFIIENKSGGANTITVTAGGATLEGVMTVAQNTGRLFYIYLTNVTPSSEAFKVLSVGA